MRNPRDTDQFRAVIDYVQNPPVADPNTPKIPMGLQFLATWRSRILPKRFHSAHSPRQNIIRQVFKLFPSGRLYLNDIASHGAVRVSSGLP